MKTPERQRRMPIMSEAIVDLAVVINRSVPTNMLNKPRPFPVIMNR